MDENLHKRLIDKHTGRVLKHIGIPMELDEEASGIVKAILRTGVPIHKARIVLCGGSGSGKSELAKELEKSDGFEIFDLDEYIPGGFTPDLKEYLKRLEIAWERLQAILPKDGWIVEHVEACNPLLAQAINPSFAILLSPPKEHQKIVAGIRSKLSGTDPELRLARASQSRHIAEGQFNDTLGVKIYESSGVTVKKLLD